MIVPATVTAIAEYSMVPAVASYSEQMTDLLGNVVDQIAILDAAKTPADQLVAMNNLRTSVDALEAIVPADLWPLPSYAELLQV